MSSSRHDGSFRLATETRTTFRTVTGRGPFAGQFLATEVVPPDQNEAGGGRVPKVALAGPAGEERGSVDGDGNYVWVERDELGREIASWREGGSGAIKTPEPISRTSYTPTGQVYETWDGNFGGVVRRTSYDEAGRVSFVQTDAGRTAEGIEYLYEAGGLGRVTRVNEVDAAGTRKLVAQNFYDAPYSAADAGFSYVAGKLS